MKSAHSWCTAIACIALTGCAHLTRPSPATLTPMVRVMCHDNRTPLVDGTFGETTQRYTELVIEHRQCLQALGISDERGVPKPGP